MALVLASERVFHASLGNGAEVAIQYALDGKKVVLSSRSEGKLKDVQREIMEQTKRPASDYPIVCVDVEKDDEFPSTVEVDSRRRGYA